MLKCILLVYRFRKLLLNAFQAGNLPLPLPTVKSQQKAYFFAGLTVLFWSTMSSAFKLSLNHISVELLLMWSVLFAVLALLLTSVILGKTHLLKQMRSRDYFMSALMGLINPFSYYLVLFWAYDLLQAQEAGMLNYAWPVVLVLLSATILKQQIGWNGYAGILISFFGLLVISTKGNVLSLSFSHPLGTILAIASAFLWAFYWILNMKDPRESVPKLFMNMVFGLFYILLYNALNGQLQIPVWQGLAGAMYIGAFEMGITFVFWLSALKHAENTARVSNLIFLSPFMALFFIRIFVGEAILPSTIAGLILIIAGILLQQIKKKPSVKTTLKPKK